MGKKNFEFTCAKCGQVHSGSPSFAFDAPYYYYGIEDEERAKRVRLTSDLCAIDNEAFFIRVVLEIPIEGADEPFTWGVWVSLSRENFKRYVESFDEEIQEGTYFGWLSNKLPYYPDTLSIKAAVHLQSGGLRPALELDPDSDHPLPADARDGVSWEKAIRIAQAVLHRPED